MLKDVTENVSVNANQNINLNLNSKTVTGTTSKDYTIATRGMLTIQGNGKVTGTTIGVRCWNSDSILKIIDGTYEGTSYAIRGSDNFKNITIDKGNYKAGTAVSFSGNGDVCVKAGSYEGSKYAVVAEKEVKLTINGGTFVGATNALNINNSAILTINDGNFTSKKADTLIANSTSNVIIKGGTYVGQSHVLKIIDNAICEINDGVFTAINAPALHAVGNSNVKINKGIFNIEATDNHWNGVLFCGGEGTLTIGNVGNSDDNIIVNDNGNIVPLGIGVYGTNVTVIVNSGTITGWIGISISTNNSNLYLNGGKIIGTGGTQTSESGFSVCLDNQNMTNVNIYLKKNSNISLMGRNKTGKDSIRFTKYVTEVN